MGFYFVISAQESLLSCFIVPTAGYNLFLASSPHDLSIGLWITSLIIAAPSTVTKRLNDMVAAVLPGS